MPTTISSGVLMTTEARGNTALALLFSVSTNILGEVVWWSACEVVHACQHLLVPHTQAVWVRLACAGVITAPFFIQRIFVMAGIGAQSGGIDPGDLLFKLSLTILLPLIAGKALRWFTRVERWVAAWKLQLKFLSSALLICVPWITMSQSAARLRQASAGAFFSLLALGAGMHVVYLAFNYAATGVLPIRLPERKTVVINASQKTVNTAM